MRKPPETSAPTPRPRRSTGAGHCQPGPASMPGDGGGTGGGVGDAGGTGGDIPGGDIPGGDIPGADIPGPGGGVGDSGGGGVESGGSLVTWWAPVDRLGPQALRSYSTVGRSTSGSDADRPGRRDLAAARISSTSSSPS